jgi:hypothetical protein
MLKQRTSLQISDLAPEKGGEAKKQAPNKQTHQKPNTKTGWLVCYRTVLWNLRTIYKLKLPHLTEGVAD